MSAATMPIEHGFDDLFQSHAATPEKYAAVPDELKNSKSWLVYRLKPRADGKKKDKIPYNPINNQPTNDPKFGVSFEVACAAEIAGKYDGIGFYVEPPFLVVDLDNCVDPPTGDVELYAAEIVQELRSYTEASPSGTGLHIWIRGEKPGDKCRKGIEMYCTRRFLTITGVHVPVTPREIREVDITPVYEKMLRGDYLEAQTTAASASATTAPPVATNEPPKIQSEGKVLTTRLELLMRGEILSSSGPFVIGDAHGNKVEYPSQSEADGALSVLLANKHGGDVEKIDADFRISSLFRKKWDEKHGTNTYGQITIASAIAKIQKASAPQPASASAAAPGGQEQDAVVFTSFADVQAVLQEWLWEGRAPIGAMAVWMGNPDVGKTLAALDLVARVTRGLDFPNGVKNEFPPSDVILCEAEDSREKTLAPRLAVAAEDLGADMARVMDARFKPRGTSRARLLQLDKDLHHLEKMVAARPECRLIVISPISAYLGPTVKTIDDGAVRAILTPLQDMAERLDICIVAIMHLNKSADYDVIYRASGAMGFIAVPRAVWLFARDQRDKRSDNRYMMPIKGNLAAKQKGTIYQIAESEKTVSAFDKRKNQMVETYHPRIFWGENTDIDANEVMQEATGPRKADQLPAAMEWVASLFNDPATGKHSPKPLPLKNYRKACQKSGFPDQTIKRAQHRLGVEYDPKQRHYTMDPPDEIENEEHA